MIGAALLLRPMANTPIRPTAMAAAELEPQRIRPPSSFCRLPAHPPAAEMSRRDFGSGPQDLQAKNPYGPGVTSLFLPMLILIGQMFARAPRVCTISAPCPDGERALGECCRTHARPPARR